MKTAAITDPGQVELIDVPDPRAQDDLVVVKIHAAPMCCEYKSYKNGKNYSLGHEAAGEVVEIARPGKVRVGDRVVVMPQYPCGKCPLCLEGNYIHCQNTFSVGPVGSATYAQYLLKPDWLLVGIPEGMSYDHAAMACCGLGPTFGAMQAMKVDAFDTVLITGMGPVGLGGVINGVFRGARVIAVESHPYRAALAEAVGAFAVIDPNSPDPLRQILDMTQGRGVDKAVDCSGVPPAQRLLIDATRRKGQVAFVGEGGDLTIHVGNDLLRKGLILHGIWHYNLADTPRILKVIQISLGLLDKMITHRFPMTQVREAFELQLTGRCGKIILNPN